MTVVGAGPTSIETAAEPAGAGRRVTLVSGGVLGPYLHPRAEDVLLAESLSMALMLVLQSTSPTERAVFVLREVFEVGDDEIAATVEKSPAAVRQIAHRARQHVDARRPREVVSAAQTRAALESFQRALATGWARWPRTSCRSARNPPSSTAARRSWSGVGAEIDGIIAVRVEDARVSGLYYVRNPATLSRVESETVLSRS